MDLRYSQKIWSLSSLLILTFFDGKSSAIVSLSNLRRVCTYFFPFDKRDILITPPANFCTAAATYSEFGKHPPRNVKDIIYSDNGSLPYVYIYDEVSISEMETKIFTQNVQRFIDHLNTLISDHNMNVMVFDFINFTAPSITDYLFVNEYNYEDFQNNLKSFFDQMKEKHHDMLFGLKIYKNAELNERVFNPNVYNKSIDFYVVNPNDNEYCKYRGSQSEMDHPPTKDEVCQTIEDLQGIGYEANKLFLTIEILVYSWKNKKQSGPEDWSFSWLCKAHPGGKRKYCRGDLNNFYDQGTVIHDHQTLPGVFIQAIDCDDYDGSCLCGAFPAVRAIYDGLTDSEKNTTLTNCGTFALLADDR